MLRTLTMVIAMALCAGSAAAKCEWAPSERPGIEKHQSAEAKPRQQRARRTPTPVTIVETPEQAAHAQEREANADEHEAADLQAQRDAANGAQRAAATAERQEIPTFVLAIIGTVVAVIALAFSVRTSNRNDKTTRAQLRAYVSVKVAGIHPVMNEQGSAIASDFVVTWVNAGATPTRRSRQAINLCIAGVSQTNGPEAEGFPDNTESKASTFMLGPGQTIDMRTSLTDVLPLIASGTHKAWVWSWVEYLDVFGGKRRTEVCVEINRTGFKHLGGDQIRANFLSSTYRLFNGADDDCYRKYGEPAPRMDDLPSAMVSSDNSEQ